MRKFGRFSVARFAGRLAALTCLGLFASAGAALAAPCAPQTAASPFAQFGDNNSYFLAPGGSFEGTAAQVGWSLSGASLTAGNESFDVNSAGDDQSLTIGAGGSATSPTVCLDKTMPYFRFFALQVTSGSDLKVQVKLGNASSRSLTLTVKELADGSMPAWAPVAPVFLVSGLLPKGISIPGALRFVVPGSTGSWQIDDVYVDPYRMN